MKVGFKGSELQVGEFFFRLSAANIRTLRKALGQSLDRREADMRAGFECSEGWDGHMDKARAELEAAIAEMRREGGGK